VSESWIQRISSIRKQMSPGRALSLAPGFKTPVVLSAALALAALPFIENRRLRSSERKLSDLRQQSER
jgi:hypothetical protein